MRVIAKLLSPYNNSVYNIIIIIIITVACDRDRTAESNNRKFVDASGEGWIEKKTRIVYRLIKP